ncbi:MAG: complex I subunit 5 family protein [Desulfurococcaceae archaeon]|nr:complex I subunit 5 family protein [Desulfurococcaceae archaeon]
MIELIFSYILSALFLTLSHRLKSRELKVLIKSFAFALIAIATSLMYYADVLDVVSLVLGISFSAIAILVSIYTIYYAREQHYPESLEPLIDLFLLAIIATYTSPSFIMLVITWTISEVLGFTLIRMGEERSIEGSLTSSRGFILTSTMTYELSVFTMITLSLTLTSASVSLMELSKPFISTTLTLNVPTPVIPLLVLGFLAKAALIPLHFWLPSAHTAAPAPASAVLSGLTVSLGFYGLYRLLTYLRLNYATHIAWFFVVTGVLSTLYGGFQALSQRDVKRLLAYSSIATSGFISTLFAMYLASPSTVTLWGLVLGILMHAAYKTTLFSEAGLIETVYGTRYIHGIRGFVAVAPISSIGGIASLFTMIGVPGTIGFVAKIVAIYSVFSIYNVDVALAIAALIGILIYMIISALIALKYIRLYYGEKTAIVKPVVLKAPVDLQAPILILGLLNFIYGFTVLGTGIYELWFLLLAPIPLAVVFLYILVAHFKALTERVLHHELGRG